MQRERALQPNSIALDVFKKLRCHCVSFEIAKAALSATRPFSVFWEKKVKLVFKGTNFVVVLWVRRSVIVFVVGAHIS